MPANYQPIAVLHRDSAAAAAGNNPGRSAGAELPDLVTGLLTAAPTGLPDLFARFDILGHDVQVTQVRLVPTGGGALATDPAFLEATLGDTSWTVTTNAGVTTMVANITSCIYERTPTRTIDGFIVTEPVASCALFDVLAAFSAPPTGFEARVWVRPRNAFSPSVAQHGAFRDPLTTTIQQLLENQLLQLTTRPGAGFQVQGSPLGALPFPSNTTTSPNFAIDCVYASTGPLGAVWFDLSDLGASTSTKTNIPLELASNTPEAFQRYPSAFYRRPNFARGVFLAAPQLGARDVGNITSVDGVPTLYATNTNLVASDWQLQIDGVAVVVRLEHGTVTGCRRPMDVWNRVIVPAIVRNTPLVTSEGLNVAGLLGRMEWLEAARFLDGYDDEGTSAFTPIAQVGMPAAP
jgi:hypothetical protein